jgi:hypothetical protein
MTRMQRFKAEIWNVLHTISPALEHQLKRQFSRSYHENWNYRTRLVRASSDNDFIPRVPDAGEVIGRFQIMHNGLKIVAGSYYGDGPIRLLRKNRGVHEPQEERIFQEVLKTICPGGIILELGAYWSFYSMWFCKEVPQARPFMVEPVAANIEFGRQNFATNGFSGHFVHAYVGETTGAAEDGTKIICVDDLAADLGLDHIAILHADIQGFELDMLKGCGRMLREHRIDWCFISTHSEELHAACEHHMRERDFVIVASIPLSESFSWDGLLVARASQVASIPPIHLSKRGGR